MASSKLGAAILRPKKIRKITNHSNSSSSSLSEFSEDEFDSLMESSFSEPEREPLIGFVDDSDELRFWEKESF